MDQRNVTQPLPEGAVIESHSNSKDHRTYTIAKYLGRGGYGITYLAESTFYDHNIPQTGRYTIKEFCLSDICTRRSDNSLGTDSSAKADFNEAMESFEHAAERLKKINHPGIVPVNEVFKWGGTIYYVMQYLGDTTLKKYVEQQGKLSEYEACSIAYQIGQALSYLHEQKITHLDVKPENVMLIHDASGRLRPMLIDFGLAVHYKKNGDCTSRRFAQGVSDGYSPFEQYAGIDRFSPQSDVYALGATLLFMLTGKTPVKADNMSDQEINNSVKGLGLQTDTITALSGALQKLRETRFNSAKDFMKLLPAKQSSMTERFKGGKREKQRTQRTRNIAIAAAIAVLLAVTGLWFFNSGGKDLESPVAELSTLDNELEPDSQIEEEETTEEVAAITEQQTDSSGEVEELQSEEDKQDKVNVVSGTGIASSTNEPTPNKPTNNKPQPTPQPTYGTVDVGYATYTGDLKNGKPEGRGTMTFKQTKSFGGYKMEAGDIFDGDFYNGKPSMGRLTKTDGSAEQIIIGS